MSRQFRTITKWDISVWSRRKANILGLYIILQIYYYSIWQTPDLYCKKLNNIMVPLTDLHRKLLSNKKNLLLWAKIPLFSL